MIHQIDIYGKDKVQKAIETIQFFEPSDGSGYWLAFSGGKDSVVVNALMDMAGVKYEAHYHVTSVDPPELVRFIKEKHPDVKFDHPRYDDGTPITMWNLIPKKKLPPTRVVRYCCSSLKEEGGKGRATVTGVRWAESTGRATNQGRVVVANVGKKGKKKIQEITDDYRENKVGGIVLNNDNDETREVFEMCKTWRRTTLNPIIDWEDDDVWEFIREYQIPYCSLYDEGFKRLGCIGCPLGGAKSQRREFERWPSYKALYIKAMDDCVKADPKKYERGDNSWKCGEDMFNWWIGNTDNVSALEVVR